MIWNTNSMSVMIVYHWKRTISTPTASFQFWVLLPFAEHFLPCLLKDPSTSCCSPTCYWHPITVLRRFPCYLRLVVLATSFLEEGLLEIIGRGLVAVLCLLLLLGRRWQRFGNWPLLLSNYRSSCVANLRLLKLDLGLKVRRLRWIRLSLKSAIPISQRSNNWIWLENWVPSVVKDTACHCCVVAAWLWCPSLGCCTLRSSPIRCILCQLVLYQHPIYPSFRPFAYRLAPSISPITFLLIFFLLVSVVLSNDV